MSERTKTPETDAALIVDAYDEDGEEYDTDIVPASLCRKMEKRALVAEQKLRLTAFAEACRASGGLPCEASARCAGYERMVRIALRWRRVAMVRTAHLDRCGMHLDMTRDLLRQAMAYCPDRGDLAGCAMPAALWSACETAVGKGEG